MPVVTREGFTVKILRAGSTSGTGLGVLLTDRHVVTCAHVVNTALGRDRAAQEAPAPDALIQVEFSLLGEAGAGPVRSCALRRWAPPPPSGAFGGDVAVLELARDDLPHGAGPARVVGPGGLRGARADIFGYPSAPDRTQGGAWSEVRLRDVVENRALQLDASSESAVRAQPGYSGSPVVLSDEGGDAVVGILNAAAPKSGDAYAIAVPTLLDAWPETFGQLLMPECPYRWLSAFTRADAHRGLFVGREQEAGELRGLAAREPLVVVTGSSGVGKSSLLAAGLGKTMEDNGWAVAAVRPETMPMDALGAALLKLERPAAQRSVKALRQYMRQLRSEGLLSLGGALSLTIGKPVLVCVDPLDNVFNKTLCAPKARTEFLEALLSVSGSAPGQFQVVCALRSELMPELLDHPEASSRLQGSFYLLSPLGPQRIRRVIEEPADIAGVRYDDGLAAVIAADTGGGNLPLLEFALAELWPYQRQRHIKLDDYVRLGRVSGALGRHAERVYQDLIDEFSEDQIRKVVLSFITETPSGTTHTPVLKTRFTQEQQAIIARLVAARLMVSRQEEARSRDIYEIAHAALLDHWNRLSEWIAADRKFLEWHSQMRVLGTSHLLPQSRLKETRKWLAERAEDIDGDIRLMIQRSEAHYRQQQRDLEDARDHAESAAQRADSLRLAALSEQAAAAMLPAAIALAVESLLRLPTLQGDIALRRALAHAAEPIPLPGHSMGVNVISFSPDGKLVVTAGQDGVVRVFSVAGDLRSSYEHSRPVRQAAFSDSGEWIIAADNGGQVCVIEAATGKLLGRIENDAINGVTFNPDGRLAATASDNGNASVFDWSSGKKVAEVAYRARVTAVRFSPDGEAIASASDNGDVCVYELKPGKERFRLSRGVPVNSVMFSPDGKLLATASSDGGVQVVDAQTGARRNRIELGSPALSAVFSHNGTLIAVAGGTTEQGAIWVQRLRDRKTLLRRSDRSLIRCVAFSHDDELVMVAGRSGAVRVFEVSTDAEWTSVRHDGPVNSVDFSLGAKKAASAGADRMARIFDPQPGPEQYRVVHDAPVSHIEFVPGLSRLMSAGADGTVLLSDAATGALLHRIRHGAALRAALVSAAGNFVATAGEDGMVRLFDLSTVAERGELAHDGQVQSLAASRDGVWLGTGSGDRTARVLQVPTGQEHLVISHSGPVASVDISADGRLVVTGSGQRAAGFAARIFALDTGTEVAALPHPAWVSHVLFSPDGSLLATVSDDRLARLFDTASGKLQAQFAHESRIGAISFSHDGRWLVTAGDDGSARVFDLAMGTERTRLAHDQRVNAIALSPGDDLVATASEDGDARVFDPATGAERNRLAHPRPVRAVAVSPDGEWLATASADHIVRVSPIGLQRLLECAKARMGRPLTADEQRRYDVTPLLDLGDVDVSSGAPAPDPAELHTPIDGSLLSIGWYRHQGWAIVEIRGELDVTNGDQLREVLDGLVARGHNDLILDMSEMTFIDSSVLHVILRANRQVDRLGGVVLLAGPRPGVAKMFRLTAADQLIPAYDSVEQALAAPDALA